MLTNQFFGYFDLMIIIALTAINLSMFYVRKGKVTFGWFMRLCLIFLFFFALPFISLRIETDTINVNLRDDGSIIIPLVLYKIPFYWFLGIFQFVLIKIKNHKVE